MSSHHFATLDHHSIREIAKNGISLFGIYCRSRNSPDRFGFSGLACDGSEDFVDDGHSRRYPVPVEIDCRRFEHLRCRSCVYAPHGSYDGKNGDCVHSNSHCGRRRQHFQHLRPSHRHFQTLRFRCRVVVDGVQSDPDVVENDVVSTRDQSKKC